MVSFVDNSWRSGRAASLVLVTALLLGATTTGDARTRRHHHPSAFRVALEPFSLVHSAVHAVAAPILRDVSHLAFDAATAPARIAFHAGRTPAARPPRPPRDAADYGTGPTDGPVYTPRRAYLPEAAESGTGIQVAYVVPQGRATATLPRADPVDRDEDFDLPNDRQEEPRDEDSSDWASSGAKPMVEGSRAVLRNGIAYAPSRAPQAVKNAIWAVNTLRNKPYVWGGGHGSFYDRGYDCSGTVSFALHGAGAIGAPMPSSDLMRYGEYGRGRWFTIYSRNGHTFAVIAGLRLDTTDFQNGGNTGPRWHTDLRDTSGYVARHPAAM